MLEKRTVVLRNIKRAVSGNEYHLRVKFNENNYLVLDGQDFSSSAEDIYGEEEYEYVKTIYKRDLPYLKRVLNVGIDEDLLDYLEANYSGEKSFELERLLDKKKVPFELNVR